MYFIEYPKCGTCRKAKAWLDEHKIAYVDRHIVEDNPSYKELKSWVERSGLDIKRFFNTSGLLYKSMGLKDRLPSLSVEKKLRLLSSDGKLIKRPIVVGDDFILVGFKESEWKEKLIPDSTP